jgi:hypothetical protein
MATKRITENHPFMKKVNELYDLMENLGICIEYDNMGGFNIVDTETNQTYKLKDLEGSHSLDSFPTGFEFKLTFESEK